MSLLLLLKDGEPEAPPGGGNRIAESGFENPAHPGWYGLSSPTLSHDEAEKHTGNASLKVVTDGSASFEGVMFDVTEFTIGEREAFEIWVRGTPGSILRTRFEDAAGAHHESFEPTGEWQRRLVSRVIAPGTTEVSVGVLVSGSQVTTYNIDDAWFGPAAATFTGDWELNDPVNEWSLVQALPGRVTAVKSNPAQGRYAGRFEVKEGDVEPQTGSNRAEVQSGLEFEEGDAPYFRLLMKVESWDFAHWGIPWQLHDDSEEPPPLCLQLKGTEEDPRLWLGPGSAEAEYWEAPITLGKWFEAIVHPVLGPEGSVEVWLNGAQQTLLNGLTIYEGIDTLGNPLAYDKLGIYRSSESKGTAVVYHDDYRVTQAFFSRLPRPPRIAVQCEYQPDKLMWRVEPASASPARWAADEPDPRNVAEDTVLEDWMPGGDKEAACSLPRDPRENHPDEAAFSDVTISQSCGEVVFEGRLEKVAEASGERRGVKIECAGWSAALDDNKALIGPGFIDSDLGKWGEPSLQRQLALRNAGVTPNFFSTSAGWQGVGDALPALVFHIERLVTETTEHGELSYHGGGIDLGGVRYNFRGHEEDANYVDRVDLCADDLVPLDEGTNHKAHPNQVNAGVFAAGDGRKYARIIVEYGNAGFSAEGLELAHRFEVPKVIGSHGLVPQGTWPEVGFTVKQMLAYAIPRYAPPLGIDEELLEDNGFIIPQAWFSEPGPMSQVVDELTRYERLDWFVRRKLFQLRNPGTYGRVWKAFVGPSGLEEVGEDAQRLWESIVVRWQDVDGSTKTAGPPGSGAQIEDPRLCITDPNHPAVKAAVTRKDILDIGGICTAEPAIAAAEMFLAEANELNRAGKAAFTGYQMESKGVMRPVAQMRSGDYVLFVDSSDSSLRKITQRRYEDASKTATVNLDAPSEGVKALLERYRARLIRLGIS